MATPSQLSRFSKSFISISSDNRIHLWDTDTRKEKRSYVEKKHLSHSYLASNWFQSSKSLGLFALACSDGVVIIWDLVRGVVATTIGAPDQSPAATAVAFSGDGSSLFVSASERVNQYRVSDGEQIHSLKAGKKGSLKMVMNPLVNVLAVAR